MAGCCGSQQSNTEWEVTFKDGSTQIVKDMSAGRILLAKDATVGRPSGSIKAVPKKKL